MSRARAFALVAIGGVFSAAGCELLVGVKDRAEGPADASADATVDASTDAPDAENDGNGDPCRHASPPPAPTTDDGTSDLNLYLAMRTIDLGVRFHDDAGPPPSIGFDIDGLCTCPAPKPCAPPVATAKQCDDDAGRDNSLSKILQTFAESSSGVFNQKTYNDAIDQGLNSLVLRVSGYNGGANDTKVTVAVFVSNGTMPTADGGAPPPPTWNGTDVFTLDQGSVIGPVSGATATPEYFDINAYVTNHVLVAHVDFPLRIVGTGTFGALTVSITGAVLVGELKPEGAAFRLDNAVLAGRWATTNIAAALAELPDMNGGFTCPGTQTFMQVKPLLCNGADIFTDLVQMDPRASCDALSVGFGLTAYPIVMGPRTARAPSASPCADAGQMKWCN